MATSARSAGRTSTSSFRRTRLRKVRSIRDLYEALRDRYGDPGWWPGTPFEIAVGAVLTQRAAWENVEMAIANMKKMHLFSPKALAGARRSEIERAIRSSGFYHEKARYISVLSKHVTEKYGGDICAMARRPTNELRNELMELPGIGPETADDILLYALGKPIFVVDAYTFRLLNRLGLKAGRTYDDLKARFEHEFGKDVQKLADMHALIVKHCKTQCTKGKRCGECCLSARCPSKRD